MARREVGRREMPRELPRRGKRRKVSRIAALAEVTRIAGCLGPTRIRDQQAAAHRQQGPHNLARKMRRGPQSFRPTRQW